MGWFSYLGKYSMPHQPKIPYPKTVLIKCKGWMKTVSRYVGVNLPSRYLFSGSYRKMLTQDMIATNQDTDWNPGKQRLDSTER